MAKKTASTTKTSEREKIAVWLDNPVIEALREIDTEVGIPVSEQIRRAIATYLKQQGKRI